MSRNLGLFLLMCLVWGLTWLPVKVGAAHVPPIFLATARFLVAGLLMLAWAGRDVLAVPAAARPRLLATALLVNTANYALLFWGVAHAPTGIAAIVNFATIPVFMLVAERVIDGGRLERRKLAAIAVGIAGIVLLFAARAAPGLRASGGDPQELTGLAAVALGTLCYCVGGVLTRPISRTMPTLTLAGWQTLIGGVGLAAVSLALEPVGPAAFAALLRWPVAPSLAFLVVGGSLIGFTVFTRLLRDWGAFRAGLYAFVSPAIAVAAGVLALGEPFGAGEAVGTAVMFVAAAMALRR